MYYDYIKRMSFQDSVIKEIADMTTTKEPLYKITYIRPKLTVYDSSDDESDDEDYGATKYSVITQICTVIYDKSTWLNTRYGDCIGDEYSDITWNQLITMEKKNHKATTFGIDVPYGHHIVCKKLSVELLN